LSQLLEPARFTALASSDETDRSVIAEWRRGAEDLPRQGDSR
jgi:hypothetical protein